jgi:2-C-methyl-D-erythritol 4-phosphate cytidylyltransferase
LGIVQTPQAFQFALLYDAYQKAMQEKFYGTDDASLVERYGGRVKAVEGDYFNIKITTQDDLLLARVMLK